MVTYRFGAFELQPTQRRLLANGQATLLAARTFDVLQLLVENAGRLVTKDEILARVWHGLVVEENNVHVQVASVRRIVGAKSIENVAGHGYRFTLDVDAGDAPQPEAPPRVHNLPRQLTRFIGRGREVAECERLLATTRLLTLTGIGGLGKTRLSLEIAEGRLARYPDGVWLVELAPLRDARLVVHAIASALGVFEEGRGSLLAAVLKHVGTRRLLVVLDNCEHLLDECARVVKQLLQAAVGLTVVATSRERMHLAGETAYPLPSLSTPSAHTLDALADSEAVRLFVDRASAAQPAFALSEGNAQAAGEICTRLDGIPLAIELAAARVRTFPVESIAQRLGDRFRLLKIGDPTLLPRQQTLQATIDWSYDLLSAPERTLLHRLAAFTGGWTLDAAESVAAGPGIEAADFLDLHGRLVEKSLVVAEPGLVRYRLLESVRLYALERLESSGEADATRARHFDFCLALAEAAAEHGGSEAEGSWYARLDAERENLRSAYAWCGRAEERARDALRLLSPLAGWLCVNEFGLGDPIMGADLARPGVQQRDRVRCQALGAAGWISYNRGRYDDACRYAEASLAIARELGDAEETASALIGLGTCCNGAGDRAAARRHLAAGLEAAREASRSMTRWAAPSSLADLDASEGRLDAAEPLYEEALRCARAMGSRHLIAIGLLNLARVSLSRRSERRAAVRMREAFAVFDDMGASRNLHAVLAFSAGLAALRGEWERAARLYAASDRELDRLGLRREPVDEGALAPLLGRAREALGDTRFEHCRRDGWAAEAPAILAELRAWIDELE